MFFSVHLSFGFNDFTFIFDSFLVEWFIFWKFFSGFRSLKIILFFNDLIIFGNSLLIIFGLMRCMSDHS